MANVLTNIGKAISASKLGGVGSYSTAVPSHVGWGTGAGTAAATDTTLFVAATEARVAATLTIITTTVTGDTLRGIATLTADAAKTITNWGWFDGAGTGSPPTGANLFAKGDHAGVALAVGDKIEYTLTFQQT